MSTEQFLRKCTLIVSTASGEGLDLSNLHIKFNIKRSDTQTPNMADIRVYNLEEQTAQRIQKEFSNVILQGGYESNFGVIFQGNIKQILRGRENATDTFIDIIAGDGDLAYNFAVVNTTIAAGASQIEQVNAAAAAMNKTGGVKTGNMGNMPNNKLSRGKVMFGMARDYLRQTAETTNNSWSVQNGVLQFVPVTSYLPGEAVILTSKTGLIGTPVQTNEGINVKCLLNPKLQVGGRILLDNKSIARLKIDLTKPNNPANIPAPTNDDGVYYILVIEYQGDNRGNDWYCNLVTLNVSVTSNPLNSVQVGF